MKPTTKTWTSVLKNTKIGRRASRSRNKRMYQAWETALRSSLKPQE